MSGYDYGRQGGSDIRSAPPAGVPDAFPAGSTQPGAGLPGTTGGIILPMLRPHRKIGLPHFPDISTDRINAFQHESPPSSGGVEHASVAEVLYNATPVSNVTQTAGYLRAGVRGRAIIPPGLAGRFTDAVPSGIRERGVRWATNLRRKAIGARG